MAACDEAIAARRAPRPTSLAFNINKTVRVKLTPHGKRVLAATLHLEPSIDAEGWLRAQMWEIMQVFGSDFHIGTGIDRLPFEMTIMLELDS